MGLGNGARAQAAQKPLRIVVGFPAGGATDVIARMIADRLRPAFPGGVIVENRVGASARLAVDFVKNAEPDGSTLLFTPDFIMTVYPHSFRRLAYDAQRDFVPLTPCSRSTLVLTAGLSLIIGTFFRFVARRLDTRPEDYGDADIADGAGELGFFSPHSWWPLLIALSFSTAAVGAALWLPWLIVAGVAFVLAAVSGLVFEYYTGPEKH